jgi:CMP-N-acetylneuraminic acid synthetase
VRIAAIIPARGGSKGITRKNLRKLGSHSLLGLKVTHANLSRCNEVYVSTEDTEIANEGLEYGSKIIQRPMDLARDDTSTDAVLLHAIDELGLQDSDILVLLQATSPFLKSEKIDECIQKLVNEPKLSAVITIRLGHPFMWHELDGMINPLGHSREKRPRRQDLGVEGWETGGCYAIRVSALRQQKVRYPQPTAGVSVNQIEALDIDTMEDLELAQELIEILG